MVRGMKHAIFLSALSALWLGCGDGATVTALHVLPGGGSDTADTDFFAMPFPNDARPKKSGASGLSGVDLSRWAQPPGQPGVYVRFLDGRLDSAGPSAAIYFRFSAPIDVALLPQSAAESMTAAASVYVVDVSPGSPTYGAKIPMLTAFHTDEGQFIGANWLSLRPVPGLPLRENTTYAAIVTQRLRGAIGETLSRHSDFDRLLSETAPDDEPYHTAWSFAGPLRAFLQAQGGAGEVINATVFTTQKATPIMAAMRASVYANAPSPLPLDFQYLRDHDGMCSLFAGTFDSPNFQMGDPPYLNEGGGLNLDEKGLPMPSRIERLRFALSVPDGDMPAAGWPVILYAHGTGGDYQSFIHETLDLRAAMIEVPGGPPVRMAMIGIDQVLHGPRDPTHGDPEITFFNLNNLAAARDNVKQGGADDFQLLRLVENFNIDKAPGDGPLKDRPIRFDAQRIYFVGHSQGGLTGPLFLAAEPKIKAAVLSGAGSVLILSLLNKRAPTDIAALVEGLLREPATEDHPLLNLLQSYFESADPNNYGPQLFREPIAGSPPKSVFQSMGLTDNYTPDPNIAAFALSLGVQPVGARLFDIDGLGLTPMRWGQRPVQKNVASGQATGVLQQYTQEPDSDGHFVIFDLWAGRHDWTGFLATHARTGTAQLQ
jgi:predicted esterase